jgi:hypothetical protein
MKSMKRMLTLIAMFVFAVVSTIFTGQAFAGPGAPQPHPTPAAQVCYALNNFPTDFLILKITPGQQDVRGRYRQCVTGASPGDGSVDALMYGTIQNVPTGNTVPYSTGASVDDLDVLTQISLHGSLATGNFGGGSVLERKVSRCWLHLLFSDPAMTEGAVAGACEWFASGGTGVFPPFATGDTFSDGITQIPCSEVLTLDGTCEANGN